MGGSQHMEGGDLWGQDDREVDCGGRGGGGEGRGRGGMLEGE